MVEIIDGFEEYKGRIDLDRIICPHCECVQGQREARKWPTAEAVQFSCGDCEKTFILMTMETPLGMAWQTWDRDPRPQHTIDSQGNKP